MSDEVRLCPKCQSKLRSNNTRGVCKACWDKGERLAGDDDAVLERTGLKPSPARRSDAVKRFRIVAEALGQDPDQMLSEYCEGWLANLKAKAAEG